MKRINLVQTNVGGFAATTGQQKKNSATHDSLAPKFITGVLCISSALMILSFSVLVPSSSSKILRYLALVLLLAAGFFQSMNERTSKRRLLLAILGLMLLTMELPFQKYVGSGFTQFALYMGLCGVLLFSSHILKSSKQLFLCACFSLLFITLVFIVSIKGSIADFQRSYALGRPRVFGGFSHPNNFGSMAAMVLNQFIICLHQKAVPNRIAAFFLCCLATVFVVISGSRTAMLFCGSFFVLVKSLSVWEKTNKAFVRVALICALVALAIVIVSLTNSLIAEDVTVNMRLETLRNYDQLGSTRYFGIGYTSSSDHDLLNELAGGATEMLLVSLLYRVGFIGVLAYGLFLLSSIAEKMRTRDNVLLATCFLAAVLILSLGESFLSSIMGFVQIWIWILLSALPTIDSHTSCVEK